MKLALFAFLAALPGYRFEFPRDHYSHPGFQTEWWYYTGNLKTPEGRRFGYELTFFRKTVNETPRKGTWEIGDAYMAHLALSDIDGGEFHHFERINRSGPGLAGADAAKDRIWNGNWKVENRKLEAITDRFTLRLQFDSQKPPVIHGVNGVSQKAACAGCASHYVSFTRLRAKGALELNGKTYALEGLSWMDHEFFTHQLTKEQTGWDWLSLQFDDETELMLFRLRRADGTIDPYSAGTLIAKDGRARHLTSKEFEMIPGRQWKKYPVEWTVKVLGQTLNIRTPLEKQELTGNMNYWEGAITVSGARSGVGYLEMTGYDKPVDLSR